MLDRLGEDVRSCIANEYDSIITITGPVGSGKSNLGVDVAVTCDPTFTLKERYVYDFLPFLNRLRDRWQDLKPGMCFLMDEATNLANNRNWNNDVNKYFTQFLEMFRSLGLILILIIPTKQRLDVYLREGNRTRYFLEALDLKNCGKWSGRGYFELSINDNGLTHYVAMGTFRKMDTSVLDEYKELKQSSQHDKLVEMIEALTPEDKEKKKERKENPARKMALYYLINEGWTYQEVSKQFGVPEGTLRWWKKKHLDEMNGD